MLNKNNEIIENKTQVIFSDNNDFGDFSAGSDDDYVSSQQQLDESESSDDEEENEDNEDDTGDLVDVDPLYVSKDKTAARSSS